MSIGGIIGGLFPGLGGGSSTGGGGTDASSAWNQMPMHPTSTAAAQNTLQTIQVTWQSALAGLVGTYGVVRQYELQRRMVDLHERSVDQAEEYLTLSKRHYDEIALPAFNRNRDHYDVVIQTWRPRIDQYLAEAYRLVEYAADYTTQMGRFMSVAAAEVAKARRMRVRQRGRYELGRMRYEEAMFSIRGAEARVAAASLGYRYEDAKKQDMDRWYWQRWSSGAELVGSAIANAISGINQGTAGATTALNAAGNAVGRVAEAVRGLSGALDEQSSFWGQNVTSAANWAGNRNTVRRLGGQITAENQTAPGAVQAITAGAALGMGGMAQWVTGNMGNAN